jgi:hypothetical protein
MNIKIGKRHKKKNKNNTVKKQKLGKIKDTFVPVKARTRRKAARVDFGDKLQHIPQ